jgi:hypothetical protein
MGLSQGVNVDATNAPKIIETEMKVQIKILKARAEAAEKERDDLVARVAELEKLLAHVKRLSDNACRGESQARNEVENLVEERIRLRSTARYQDTPVAKHTSGSTKQT